VAERYAPAAVAASHEAVYERVVRG